MVQRHLYAAGVGAPDAAAPISLAPPLADPAVRRVAIVRLRVGLGDLLCSVPALRALRRARPDVEVVVVTWAEMAPVVARMRAYVDELLDFPGWPGIPERPAEPALLPGFLREARARRFDLALQAYGANPVANEVTAALGAARTGGFAPAGWSGGDPHLTLPYPLHLHEVERHLRLMERLGVPRRPGDQALEFPLTAQDEVRNADLAAGLGLRRGRYVVVHPGATSASRRWPVERFAAVADGLAARGLRVLVTGVRGEEEVTRAVVDAARSPLEDVTGRTTLGSFAALLRDAGLVVANDTGTAHLAAAVGAPSVTVFLSGDPVRWAHGTHGKDSHPALHVDVGCNPCPHLRCPIDHRCATAVTVPAVLAEANRLLERQPGPTVPRCTASA